MRYGAECPTVPHMTHALLIITLLVLLAALCYARLLKRLLDEEAEEATDAFAKWRHAENQLSVMTAKATRLLGEKAQADYKVRTLESELRKKHRRVRI